MKLAQGSVKMLAPIYFFVLPSYDQGFGTCARLFLMRSKTSSCMHKIKRYQAARAGVFVSSWLGGLALQLGEWIIKKLPLVKHIYSAAKQVSAAVNPANETAQSFRECVIIRHPRHGEYAFGFITGHTRLQVCSLPPLLPTPPPLPQGLTTPCP